MIEKLIGWSYRNRFLVLLGAFLATVFGVRAMLRTPLDAIPDLSDPQVIVFAEWEGRSPDLIEDQITYPIVTSLLSAPKIQFVRGQSIFGMSFVYAIFEEGTDIYWARSRVLEYLSEAIPRLPEGVQPVLGPDATGVGWVFEYALRDTKGKMDLAQLRSLQDWHIKYALESLPGVAEVASVGGHVKQYQVEVKPGRLAAWSIPISEVIHAIRRSNQDVGGRVLELSGREYVVRGRGYIRSLADLENIAVAHRNGTPILLRDVARVQLGPEIRRGLAELDGEGEVVGGIVVMRYGENALRVIGRVKERLEEIQKTLPEGVKIVTAYDRSDLILRSIRTLVRTLGEEFLIVSVVCLIFLYHFPSAMVAILMLPVAVLLSFIPMERMGLTTNIMSLGGIAVAIGAMVDAAIVMIENAHKQIEHEPGRPRDEVLLEAAKQVGRPLFFTLLVITVSFLPIFTLEAQEGRLFKPLAWTKTFSMFFASILSVTLVPVLMRYWIRGRITPEEKNPVSRFLKRIYEPAVRWVLRHPRRVIGIAAGVVLLSLPLYFRLGSEFMPPLWEGSFLYMPTSPPGMPVEEARRVIQIQDRILKSFPEVDRVFGKIGRSETPTDMAPLSMVETVVTLKPQKEWRRGMTVEKLKEEMNRALRFPGMPNIWWMPIQTRIEMLTTGVRSPVGIKVLGPDLEKISEIARRIEAILPRVRGATSVFAERPTAGYYLDFEVDRLQAARYGLAVAEVEEVIQTAIGGMNITQTVEGRERYPVNVRYPRDLRMDPEQLARTYVATPSGSQVPIGLLARIRRVSGPPEIRDEEGMLAAFVFVDVSGRDLGGWVKEARALVEREVRLPPGVRLEWAGQYRYLERAKKRLRVVVPLTLAIVFMLLYLNTRSAAETFLVLLAVPFSLAGAIGILWILNYNISVAVWVGIIALAGLDAETGVVMLLYLDLACKRRKAQGRLNTEADLEEAIVEGAAERIRPKAMTVAAIFMGLLPILWSSGAGADVMRRIAAPMLGGVLTSFIGELLVYPAIYRIWKGRTLPAG